MIEAAVSPSAIAGLPVRHVPAVDDAHNGPPAAIKHAV